jgi:hypothetical protein
MKYDEKCCRENPSLASVIIDSLERAWSNASQACARMQSERDALRAELKVYSDRIQRVDSGLFDTAQDIANAMASLAKAGEDTEKNAWPSVGDSVQFLLHDSDWVDARVSEYDGDTCVVEVLIHGFAERFGVTDITKLRSKKSGEPQEWRGQQDELPPYATECEGKEMDINQWQKIAFVAEDPVDRGLQSKLFIGVRLGGENSGLLGYFEALRPIQTDRDKAIDAVEAFINSRPSSEVETAEQVFGLLYDAGMLKVKSDD